MELLQTSTDSKVTATFPPSNVLYCMCSGGLSEVAPPVPIPNTEVKLRSADDTASARVWENRSLPGDYFVKSSRYAWAFFVFKKLT